ncbi:MAG: hypothetical protein HOV68_11345 [Streptomycetaceae bacterium]|nr:hypothetical protein [Streptomycetaceae bacterium]
MVEPITREVVPMSRGPEDEQDPERDTPERHPGFDPERLYDLVQLVEVIARIVMVIINGDGPSW